MSAYILSNNHISALVLFASTRNIQVFDPQKQKYIKIPKNEKRISQELLNENYRSVNTRYKEKNSGKIFFNVNAPLLSAVEAIKAAHSFEYQSCETDDYKNTYSHKLMKAIISRATSELPGYKDAKWSID